MSSPETGPEKPRNRFLGLTPQVRTRAVVLICGAIALYWASLYVFVPGLPVYAEDLGASLSMVGVVVASYAIAQMLIRVPLGVWADIIGRRKPFLVAGFLAAALGALLMGLAPNSWALFGGRTITGVAGATWVAFTVFFASYFPRNQTAQAMGIISALNGASIVIATLFGGYAAEMWGWRMTFFIATGLAFASLPLFLCIPEKPVKRSSPFSYRAFVKMPSLPLLLLVSCICILGQFVIHGTSLGFVPVHGERIGASQVELGYVITAMFAASALGSLVAIYLVNRLGYSITLLLSFLAMAGAFVWVPFIQSVPLLVLSQVLVGIGRGIFFAVLLALSIQTVPSSERTTAMGVFQSLYAIGMFLGPFLLGFVADGFGLNSVFYISAAVCVAGGVLALTPAIVRLRAS